MIEHWSRMRFLQPSVSDVIDIAVVAFIIYGLFTLISGTRALQMMMGFVILVIAAYLAQALQLEALNEIFQAGQLVWVIAILIVFQPELRSALARIGRTPVLKFFVKVEESPVVAEVVKAAAQLSKDKRGAIIAIQREVGLMEYVESGKRLQAEVSSELLATIFAPYTTHARTMPASATPVDASATPVRKTLSSTSSSSGSAPTSRCSRSLSTLISPARTAGIARMTRGSAIDIGDSCGAPWCSLPPSAAVLSECSSCAAAPCPSAATPPRYSPRKVRNITLNI